MSNGVTITRSHPTGGTGLTTEQLDTVRGEVHRRVLDENQYLRRERNALADRVLSLTHRAALAEEERDALARRLARLAEMTTEEFELLRDAGVLKGWVTP